MRWEDARLKMIATDKWTVPLILERELDLPRLTAATSWDIYHRTAMKSNEAY